MDFLFTLKLFYVRKKYLNRLVNLKMFNITEKNECVLNRNLHE